MRIFYFAPYYDGPAGGVRIIYNHVDILRQLGYEAYVIHSKRGFRCTWFENSTPILFIGDIKFQKEDYLVMPEIHFYLIGQKNSLRDKVRKFIGHKLDNFYARELWNVASKKVIFNQNAYHTLVDFSNSNPFKSDFLNKITGYLSISTQNKEYLEFAFPRLFIQRLQWSLEPEIYGIELSKKRPVISYLPRKNPDHSKQVLQILNARKSLNGFEIKEIQGLNQSGVAQLLKESVIFLSFGYPEGLPLPPAEAMACGCIVVGYNGGGGKEYFLPEFSYEVPFGDIVGFCKKVEEVIGIYKNDRLQLEGKMQSASNYILDTYSRKIEKEVLNKAWGNILK